MRRRKKKGWRNQPLRHSLASQGIRTVRSGYSPSSVANFRNRRIESLGMELNSNLIRDTIEDEGWLDSDSIHINQSHGQFIIDFAPEGEINLSTIVIEDDRIYATLRLPEGFRDEKEELKERLDDKFDFDTIRTYFGGEAHRPHVQFAKGIQYSNPRYYYDFVEEVIDTYGDVVTEYRSDYT